MAIIESKFFSKELFRSVCVNVILPLPDSGDNFFEVRPIYHMTDRSIKYFIYYMVFRQIILTGHVFPNRTLCPGEAACRSYARSG